MTDGKWADSDIPYTIILVPWPLKVLHCTLTLSFEGFRHTDWGRYDMFLGLYLVTADDKASNAINVHIHLDM